MVFKNTFDSICSHMKNKILEKLLEKSMNKTIFRAGSMVTPVDDFTEIIRLYSEEYQHYNGGPVKCIHMHNSFAKYVSNVVKKFDSSGKHRTFDALYFSTSRLAEITYYAIK